MSILNIELFNQCKYLDECNELDSNILNNILNNFNNSNNNKIKNKKIIVKKQNILKNVKIQVMKDKVNNKINLILNKLSENNLNNLVIEFINNIKINNQLNLNEFYKAIYFKIINEFKFANRYLSFFKIISSIYIKVNNFNMIFFYNLIESKFNYDYINENIDSTYDCIKEIECEDKRLNNLFLINKLINLNLLDIKIIDYINHIILNQNKYYTDIYYWFKEQEVTLEQINKINTIIKDNKINTRDKILLENISKINKSNEKNDKQLEIVLDNVDNDENDKQLEIVLDNEDNIDNIDNEDIEDIEDIEDNKPIFVEPTKQIKKIPFIIKTKLSIDNSFNIDNLIDEYLHIENITKIEYFINKNCINANLKNKFCELIINKYLNLYNDNSNKIIILLKQLINIKIIFKSNLSRGLINIMNNSTQTYLNNNKIKLKSILLFLKNNSITHGIENYIIEYNI